MSNTMLAIRVDEDLTSRLQAAAAADDRTVGSFVRRCLNLALAEIESAEQVEDFSQEIPPCNE
jgi:predicted HicB family RNase H-like nuclease